MSISFIQILFHNNLRSHWILMGFYHLILGKKEMYNSHWSCYNSDLFKISYITCLLLVIFVEPALSNWSAHIFYLLPTLCNALQIYIIYKIENWYVNFVCQYEHYANPNMVCKMCLCWDYAWSKSTSESKISTYQLQIAFLKVWKT